MADLALMKSLKDRRIASRLTQRALAERSGIPQPNIAAYESGRRVPAPETLDRLIAALRIPTLDRIRSLREPILRAAAERGITDIRVFGSVARGEAGPDSDLDLLIRPAPDTSLFDLARFELDVHELVGVEVDVVSDRGSGPVMSRILEEAIPL